jgi:Nucleoside transporter
LVPIPLGVYLFVFAVTTVLVTLRAIPQWLFMALTVSGLFVCGACSAVASAGIVGAAALFPVDAGINPYFAGQAAGGLIIAIANTLSSYLDDPDIFWVTHCRVRNITLGSNEANGIRNVSSVTWELPTSTSTEECLPYAEVSWSTFSYFLLSCIILAACLVGYGWIEGRHQRSAFRQPACTQLDHKEAFNRARVQCPLKLFSIPSFDSRASSTMGTAEESFSTSGSEEEASDDDEVGLLVSNCAQLPEDSWAGGKLRDIEHEQPATALWRSMKGPALSLFWTYSITLAAFPVLTSGLSSVHECVDIRQRWYNDLFTPLTFLMFNFGDFFGRALMADVKFGKSQWVSSFLVISSLLRAVYIPLFFLCHASDPVVVGNRLGWEEGIAFEKNKFIFTHDWISWVIQFSFAVSNGALTRLCFGYAPTFLVADRQVQQNASTLLNFSLCLGLLVGSLASFPLHDWSRVRPN